jgi:hypothetical protein
VGAAGAVGRHDAAASAAAWGSCRSFRRPARPAGGRSWTWTRLVLVTGETVQFDSSVWRSNLVLRTA